MVPEDLRYTQDHEWVSPTDSGTVRVGITDYAQSQLGDVVHVQLPDVGEPVTAGSPIGEVESTKSVSDVYAPVAGEVVACNEVLDEQPELINSDPYGEGWMMEIKLADESALDALLDAEDYRSLIEQG
ncbi:MAG TPA: glycine cleavage system protein GcvH [Pseudonocardiaceae bacterium]|nr:glycine cleavage system protein GcvH [Pseudonocardiaceae bacterium]